MTFEIALRERGGPTLVSTHDWQQYDLELYLRPLANAGVISVQSLPAGTLIFPGHFVGGMRAPEVTLTVTAKSPQMVAAMQALAMRFLGRTVTVPEIEGRADANVQRQQTFADALRDCVNEGIPWTYVRVRAATSNPRGKIHLRSTLRRFLSAGVTHRLVAESDVKTQRVDFAAVVHTAYRCLGMSAHTEDRSMVMAGRYLALFPPDPSIEIGAAILLAEQLLREAELQPASRTLISRCLDILQGQVQSAVATVEVPGGVATFMDLERLWEMAVAQLCVGCSLGAVLLHGLRGSSLKLLSEGGPSIDPDIIIQDDLGRSIKVVDAKYKVINGAKSASTADLYQVAAYADTIGVDAGYLIYLGSETSQGITNLGETNAGAEISVVVLSPESLLSRGEAALLDIISQETV